MIRSILLEKWKSRLQKVSCMVNMWSSEFWKRNFSPVSSQYCFSTKVEPTKLGNRVHCTGQRRWAELLSPETPEDQVSILRPQLWAPWWEARLHWAFQMPPVWVWRAVKVQNHCTGAWPGPKEWGVEETKQKLGLGWRNYPHTQASPKPDRRNYNTIWGECSLHKSTHCSTDIQRRCFLLSPEQMFVKWELLVLLRVYWSLTR